MSGEDGLTAPTERQSTLATCLGAAQRETVPQLIQAMQCAHEAGAQPFEVIAGSPHHRYGARITFSASSSAVCRQLDDAIGLPVHAWGNWSWIGLRVHPDGCTEWKRYHQPADVPFSLRAPRGALAGLVPVMASLHKGDIETYYRLPSPMEWHRFAEACADLAGGPPPDTHILPRPAPDAFCVSLRTRDGDVRAVTIFADDRALPDEATLSSMWRSELPDGDCAAYDITLAGVRSLGRRPARGWHAMLAWAVDVSSATSRAVSFRLGPGGSSGPR